MKISLDQIQIGVDSSCVLYVNIVHVNVVHIAERPVK